MRALLPRYYLLDSGGTFDVIDSVTGEAAASRADKWSALLALAALLAALAEDEDEEEEEEGEAEGAGEGPGAAMPMPMPAAAPGVRSGPVSLVLRAGVPGDKLPSIIGYAAVYEQPARVRETIDGRDVRYVETIATGAFGRGLAAREVDPVALAHHDAMRPLGRRSAGTLRLADDAHGQAVEVDPPDTTYARDLVASIARGDVRGMSVGFDPLPDGLDWSEDFARCRVRAAVPLEVSCVTWPAYGGTSVGLRSRAGTIVASSRARAAFARRLARARQLGRVLDARLGPYGGGER